MSKITTRTETKTLAVSFFPSEWACASFRKTPEGIGVRLEIQNMLGRYENNAVLTQKELVDLANALLELAK